MVEINWLECSKCSIKYEFGVNFHLIECGHILCGVCVQKIKRGFCALCKTSARVFCLPNHGDPTTKIFISAVDNILKGFIEAHNAEIYKWKNIFAGAHNKIIRMQNEMEYLKNYIVGLEADNGRLNRMLRTLIATKIGSPVVVLPMSGNTICNGINRNIVAANIQAGFLFCPYMGAPSLETQSVSSFNSPNAHHNNEPKEN